MEPTTSKITQDDIEPGMTVDFFDADNKLNGSYEIIDVVNLYSDSTSDTAVYVGWRDRNGKRAKNNEVMTISRFIKECNNDNGKLRQTIPDPDVSELPSFESLFGGTP